MIKESRDIDLLLKATEGVRDMMSEALIQDFFNRPGNLMFVEDENVGLATLEYPGVFSVHWHFKSRGRAAIDLAKTMIKNLFDNYEAHAVRGLIKTRLKAARWACRQVGLKSYGFVTFADGDENELFCISKKDFLEGLNHG
jgi:hypothetical protein